MANSNGMSDAFDFGMQDPNDMQSQEDQQYGADMANPRLGSAQGNVIMQRGFNNFAGGSPQVKRAQAMQSAMSQILTSADAQMGDSADPLDKQILIAQGVQRKFADLDPKIAMSANDRLIQLQQAKTQQATLSLNQQEAQLKLNQQKLEGGSLNVAGFDAKTGEYKTYGTIDASDPQAAQKLAQYKQVALAGGVSAGILSDDALAKNKDTLAFMKINAGIQEAQIRANAMTQAALIRAQAQGNAMNSRDAMMTNRVFSAANLGATALQNFTELPLGTTGGFLGIGSSPGPSMLQAGMDTLRNKAADETTRAYKTMSAGLERNLAMIEMQGGLQGGQHFSEQIGSALAWREGDTNIDIMRKLAEARQIIVKGTQVYMTSPKLSPQLREVMQQSLSDLAQAVPFTVHDITSYLAAQKKNPGMTMADYAKSVGLGDEGAAPNMVRLYKNGVPHDIPADKADDAMTNHGYTKAK